MIHFLLIKHLKEWDIGLHDQQHYVPYLIIYLVWRTTSALPLTPEGGERGKVSEANKGGWKKEP